MRTVIVIPARNEAALIDRCLRSIAVARRAHCSVVVVADSCDDDTAAIARGFSGVEVLEVAFANVGAARRAGIEYAIAGATWIACTDADSVVPENWITDQRAHERRGADVVVGTVRPDPRDLDEQQLLAWTAKHDPINANGHVHGANLGIRASSYTAVGGFRTLAEHEDVELVARLAASGAAIVAANTSEVLTSGRSLGRTPGGYARYLSADLIGVDAIA